MNNEKYFRVVLLTILLQHAVSSPTSIPQNKAISRKASSSLPSNLTKIGRSSWPPKLPSYDIWGSGDVIKKKSLISKNNSVTSKSSSTSILTPSSFSSLKSSSQSHLINENDIDDEGNIVYVQERKSSKRRNGKGN